MRIEELRLCENAGWSACEWKAISGGLSAVYGGPQSGKTTLAELLFHVLYGQPRANAQVSSPQSPCPDGEVIVEDGDLRYRLRRYQAGAVARLTVSAIDGAPVERQIIRRLVGQLPSTVLGPLCAVSFANGPNLAQLLSSEFATGFQAIGGGGAPTNTRRTAELAVRRDQLAHELETRIAGERRASKELDSRWRELDRLVREEQQLASTLESQLHSIEAALAETDARLRYRRLELNTDLSWHSDDCDQADQILSDLDEQIARWRASMAELAQREASVRAGLAKIQPERRTATSTLAEQRAWLAVARQLSADLAGEISRLARASASQQCVCHDAHPRLRPIAETIQRQLEVMEALLVDQQSELQTAALRNEIDHLSRAETELRRHVEHLVNHRQTLTTGARARRQHAATESTARLASGMRNIEGAGQGFFTAADVEQLEQRRMELEQERFQLVEQVRVHRRKLRDLRAQRDTVARQRAALLSARSIEHVQRELADVQRKLERVMDGSSDRDDLASAVEDRSRASDFLAQLTDGKLLRLALVEQGRRAHVSCATGESRPVESLTVAERDLVYLSLCLALLSAAARRGVWLPLVLDDPFLRLDERATASLAAVLEAFCRQGHQVIVFTGQQAAAQRLVSLGVTVREIASLRNLGTVPPAATTLPATEAAPHDVPMHRTPRSEKGRPSRRADAVKRKKAFAPQPRNGKAIEGDQSDAA